MHLIHARNVNDALPAGLNLLHTHGIREESRNGPVIRIPAPVTTVLSRPAERVLFAPWRDVNPFFHVVESAWMLAGRDDLKQLTPYVARMKDYSDDGGVTQPGAYGKRWRRHTVPLGTDLQYAWNDQLDWAVKRLRADSNDRRVVISMWDAGWDQHAADCGGKDVPCNLTMLPWISDGSLHLTIFNRSNDILWGLYGANAAHFSMCLEYLAGRIGLGVGTMTTVSNNLHGYVATLPDSITQSIDVPHAGFFDPYVQGEVAPLGLFQDWRTDILLDSASDQRRERVMQEDLRIFFEHGAVEAATKARWPWMRRVLVPMALAHAHWKKPGRKKQAQVVERHAETLSILDQVQAADWQLAARGWIDRRAREAMENASE